MAVGEGEAALLMDEQMTDAEFRCVREWLAVDVEWLAQRLGVADRTVRRWEAGTSPIPDGVRIALEQLEYFAACQVGEAVERLRDMRDPEIVVYRTDAAFEASVPGVVWPASWQRRVAMRAALEVAGVAIKYANSAAAVQTLRSSS